jgi:hypothetical protein
MLSNEPFLQIAKKVFPFSPYANAHNSIVVPAMKEKTKMKKSH